MTMPNVAYASPQVKMSTLHTDLILQGITDPDAQILADAFIDQTPSLFIDGMERLAHVLSITRDVTSYGIPATQPWIRIWFELIGQPNIDQSFQEAIQIYEPLLRDAIQRTIIQRSNVHRAIHNQGKAKTSKLHKTYEILQLIQNKGHSVRLNMCRGIEDNGHLMTNSDYASIRNEMRDLGVRGMDHVSDVILEIAQRNAYHPVREYLNALAFEGGDPIGDLANHFTCEYGMFSLFLRRWLIGACAKVFKAEQNRMLVLDGEKGLGKSHFALWLASPLPDYHIEEELDTHDEDNHRRIAENWIWEVKELGSSMRKSDWESMKGIITQRFITFRRKYDKVDSRLDALSSFIGTINNEEGFLPTSDRRYYTERILNIDWGYTKIDINQVWAQAMMLYRCGESWQPTTDQERTEIEKINEDYRILDPVEETVKKFFKIDTKQSTWWLSSLEIMQVLKDPLKGNLRAGTEIDTRKMARALTKLGLDKPKPKRIGNNQVRGYFGIDYIV